MQKTKKFKCVVTGKETTFTDDYINKKIEQYESLERFAKLYVSRDVKSQLKRGSKIKDIIRILNIEELTLSDEDITEIEKYYNNSIFRDMSTINEALTAFTYDKSDPDVETFINKYII